MLAAASGAWLIESENGALYYTISRFFRFIKSMRVYVLCNQIRQDNVVREEEHVPVCTSVIICTALINIVYVPTIV